MKLKVCTTQANLIVPLIDGSKQIRASKSKANFRNKLSIFLSERFQSILLIFFFLALMEKEEKFLCHVWLIINKKMIESERDITMAFCTIYHNAFN